MRIEELGGVDGGQQGDGNGKEQGVEGPLEGADDQGNQGQLGLKVIGAARGLPEVLRRVLPLVPDPGEKGLESGFRMGVLEGVGMDGPGLVQGEDAVKLAADKDILEGDGHGRFPADIRGR